MKVIKVLELFVKTLSIILLAVLVFMIFFQVASRFIIGVSYPMIEELSTLLLAWCSFLAASYTVNRKAHIAIEYFVSFLTGGMQRRLAVAIDIMILSGLIILFYYSLGLASRQMLMPMAMVPLPRGIIYISFPVGMGITAIFIFADLFQRLTNPRYGNQEK